MRPGQRKFGKAVIEPPERPIIGVMALLASLPQCSPVLIAIFMAVETGTACRAEARIHVAALTGSNRMHAV